MSRRPLLTTCTAFLSLACAGEPTVPDSTTDATNLAALHDAPLSFSRSLPTAMCSAMPTA